MRLVPFLLLLFFSSYLCVLRAQSTNGSIAGPVTDPTKAIIVDAKVAAINVGTNVRYEQSVAADDRVIVALLNRVLLSIRTSNPDLPDA